MSDSPYVVATAEQRAALIIAAQADDLAKDRINYDYASDILKECGTEPYSLWPQPNDTVRAIIEVGEAAFDQQIVVDDENIANKGYYLEEQADFVEAHQDSPALCEALGNRACRGSDCMLYKPASDSRHEIGLCREYKLVFRKLDATPDPLELVVPSEAPEDAINELDESDPQVAKLFHGKLKRFDNIELANLARPIERYIVWYQAGKPNDGITSEEIEAAVDAIISLEHLFETSLLSNTRSSPKPGSDIDYAEGRLRFFHQITED